MRRAFPGSEYYGGSAPPGPIGGRCAQPRCARWVRAAGQVRDGSRVHCGSLVGVGARLCPCGIAAGTPQTFPAASLAAHEYRHRSSPPVMKGGCAPLPAQIRQVSSRRRIKGRHTAGSSRTPLRLAHRARAIRQCRARPGFVRAAPALMGTWQAHRPSTSWVWSPPGRPRELACQIHARTPTGTRCLRADRRDLVTVDGSGRVTVIRTPAPGLDPSGESRAPLPAAATYGRAVSDTPAGSGDPGARAGMGGRGRCHPQDLTPYSDRSRRALARTGALRAAGVTNG